MIRQGNLSGTQQFKDNNKILFSLGPMSYEYNLTNKKLTKLGENMTYPFITDDNKYLIYYVPSWGNIIKKDESEKIESGLFVKNLKTNEEKQIYNNRDEYGDINIKPMKLINTSIDYSMLVNQ